MNHDILRKTMLHMDKASIASLYPLIRSDKEALVSLIDRYGSRLNTLSVYRLKELLKKVILLGRYELAMKYLDRICMDKSIRVLYKLAQEVDIENINVLCRHIRQLEWYEHISLYVWSRPIVSQLQKSLEKSCEDKECNI
jgi:hypothetical protein